jgi:hypothetical protein
VECVVPQDICVHAQSTLSTPVNADAGILRGRMLGWGHAGKSVGQLHQLVSHGRHRHACPASLHACAAGQCEPRACANRNSVGLNVIQLVQCHKMAKWFS